MNSYEMAIKIASVLDEMKAVDLKVINIEEISSLGDFFVISSGLSTTAVKAQADKVEMKLKEEGIYPHSVEGYRSEGWILIDYGSVIVHVFTNEARLFYDLDKLWQDGKIINTQE